MATPGINQDDFLFRLIESGHKAIFHNIAFYVTSGIALIQMIVQLRNRTQTTSASANIYVFIYAVLSLVMTVAVIRTFRIMHNQNGWARQLSDVNQRNLFFESRSRLSRSIVGDNVNSTNSEKVILVAHSAFLFALLIIGLFS
jgi:hypothetical protein